MDNKQVMTTVSSIKAEERRHGGWLDSGFQKRYISILLLAVLSVSFVLFVIFGIYAYLLKSYLISEGFSENHAVYKIVDEQLRYFFANLLIVVGGFCLFSVGLGSILSHRIAGPIHSLKRSLEAIARGDLSTARLEFRKNDEFQDVAKLMNEVLAKVSERPS